MTGVALKKDELYWVQRNDENLATGAEPAKYKGNNQFMLLGSNGVYKIGREENDIKVLSELYERYEEDNDEEDEEEEEEYDDDWM